jgi:transcriptional regulator with XRE-family HTH domain
MFQRGHQLSKQSGDQFKTIRLAQKSQTAKVWEIIREAGIKRRWVAKHLGVSYGYLNQVQYGHAPMSKAMRERLSEYLGIPESDLFSDMRKES